MDTDFHEVINVQTGDISEKEKSIKIGNHVWVGCRSTILKGSIINDDTIVAANSCVVKKETESAVLLAGNPAKIKKRNVSWKFK